MRRRAFLGVAAALALPVVAGCAGGDGGDGGGGGGGGMYGGGGGSGGSGGGETTTAGTTTAGGGGGAMAAYPDYTWEQLTRADAAETASVTMRDAAFQPLVAKVSAGTEVTWTNEDGRGHGVTIPTLSVDETVPDGESTSVTFEEAGAFDYVCTFHPPDMLGRIVVE